MLWLGTVMVVVAARIGLPLWRSLRHGVRVVAVTPAGPGVVSILLRGRRLDPVADGRRAVLPVAVPAPRALVAAGAPVLAVGGSAGRSPGITIKDLGDHSAGLARVRPGTWVGIEGPYGTFTADTATRRRLLLVGAGAGTAPVLARLQELPREADVVVLLRGSTPAQLVLREDVADEVGARGGRLVELVGPRGQVRLDAAALRRLVPDLRRREVYLCGPDALSHRLAAELESAGVDDAHVHFESFTF